MYTKKKYSFKDLLLWTRMEILVILVITLIPAVLFEVAELRWLRLPWTPIAVVGTAVAFLIGFQNNAAYGRAWEARTIWGGIVNASRSWAIMARDMVTNEHARDPAPEQELDRHRSALVHRHIAWLAALRHAMRQPRPWEAAVERSTDREWMASLNIPERRTSLDEDLRSLLEDEERTRVLGKTNQAAAILSEQSRHLLQLKERGLIWEFAFLEMEAVIRELLTLQGKSERIKNFPYPRQYATLSYDVVRIFVVMLPFGVIPAFADIGASLDGSPMGPHFVWLAVPMTAAVSWIFHTLQRIGTAGENPFEGMPNDVPISTMSRAIEIDLRQMLDEPADSIPEPLAALRDTQM